MLTSPATSGARAGSWFRRLVGSRTPQQVVLWMAVAYGLFISALWSVEELADSMEVWALALPIAFMVFLLALPLRDPWRMTLVVLGAAVLVPGLDYAMPELRSRGSAVFPMIATIVGGFVLAYAGRRRSLLFAGLCWLGWGVAWERSDPDLSGFTFEFVLPTTVITAAGGWAVGTVIRRRRAAEEEVARLLERRRRERVGLARELHDSVARDLTIIAMQSAVLRSTDRPEEQEYARSAIEETARSGLDALKRLLVVLRAEEAVDGPALVRDLVAEDLPDAVAEAARHLTLLGYQVTVSTVPDGLARAAETTAVRVIREGTTNITKHASTGAVCRLDCRVVRDDLVVRVENRLHASAPSTEARVPSTGLGLESLAERLRLLGGSLTAGPADGAWVLEATIPLTAPLAGSVGASERP